MVHQSQSSSFVSKNASHEMSEQNDGDHRSDGGRLFSQPELLNNLREAGKEQKGFQTLFRYITNSTSTCSLRNEYQY